MGTDLGGKVRDRPRPEHAGVARAPRVRRRQVLLHPAVGVIDAAVQHKRRSALFEPCHRNLLQQRNRIVVELAPEHRIERAEDARGVVIPAPPHVPRERLQPVVSRRDELSLSPRLADD
jgi:hypothetical protein